MALLANHLFKVNHLYTKELAQISGGQTVLINTIVCSVTSDQCMKDFALPCEEIIASKYRNSLH